MFFEFAKFLDQLINAVTLGAVYGLIAIGYTMVYGIIGMINFAHGEIFMIGTFISLIVFLVLGLIGITWVPLAVLIVVVVAMAFTLFYGWTLERVAYRPLRGSPRLAALITAIGMSIFLQNYVQLLQGARTKPLKPVITGGIEVINTLTPSGQAFKVNLSFLQMFIIILTVVLMVIFTIIITKTALGRAQRACEQDLNMAALLGINVDRTISLTFVIGAALAAVAGVIFMLRYGATDFFVGFLTGVKAFTAAVLGGIGSIPGAMLGGVLIAFIEVMFAAYFSTEYKDVATFSILVLVLIFRPTGLLGKPDIEKV
ncbi:MAG: branched-chain amino acid ABC transporter permease LivH [Alphaproteobacteria bacterium]